MKRYSRLERAYFSTYDSERKETILKARKELHRIWQELYLKGLD